jgi:hypothetical protein
MKRFTRVAVVLSAAGAIAAAQEWQDEKGVTHKPKKEEITFMRGAAPVIAGGQGHTVMFFSSDTQKKGAPYAAEAATESVQTLSDGNRIVNKTSMKMYRDSEGRTRTENVIPNVGVWETEAKGERTIVTIHDPVDGALYTLNPQDRTASKAVVKVRTSHAPAAAGTSGAVFEKKVEVVASGSTSVTAVATSGAEPAVAFAPAAAAVFAGGPVIHQHVSSEDVKKESLGKQVIEGVECEGTRITSTIPAGAIGNERAISTVSETWHSPELGIDLLRKHSDPRGGETTYKVQYLNRSEQPRSLFEIPSDYKVEDPTLMMKEKMEKLRMKKPAPVREEI